MGLNKKRANNDTNEDSCTSRKRSHLSQTEPSELNNTQSCGALNQCGIILRMNLKNFMCHSNLVINFHKRVNFLVGCNGSGKSAIMAAIVLGLGARANATNRSSNMKGFIKTGETSAKIEITICNEGLNGFERDIYGDTIIVVRNIALSSTTLLIKSESGNTITKKASDLQRILLYHNIQVDNPVFILNQDSAREFLKELEPKKNYKLFLKATQIETITEKLNDCYQSYVEEKQNMKWLEEKNTQLKKEIEELKEKYTQLMSVAKLKEVLKRKQMELNWAIVMEKEKDLQDLFTAIRDVEKTKQDLIRLLDNNVQIKEELSSNIKLLEKELQKQQSFVQQENVEFMKIKSICNELNDKYNQVEVELKSIKRKFTFLEEQISQLKHNIEERTQNGTNVETLREENEKKLEELFKRREEIKSMVDSTKRDLKIFLDSKIKTEEQINELKVRQEDAKRAYHKIQSQIQNITNSSRDKFAIYGENISQLIQKINQYYKAGKFCELPRGPLGQYVEVINVKYRDIVESQIGGILRAFLVHNKEDRKVLDYIIRTTCPNFSPIIITTKFMNKVYDVSRGKCEPQAGTILLMDLIKCSDPVVMNCLIDRIGIETILISESKSVAESITSEGRNVPRNLKKVILLNPGLEYFPEPNYRMYSMRISHARFIQVDTKDRIRQLEQEMTKYTQLNEQFSNELPAIYSHLNVEQQRIQEKRSILERHEITQRKLEETITELENFEYPQQNEIEILKKELHEMNIRYEQLSHKHEERNAQYDDLANKVRSHKDQMDSIRKSMNQANEKLESIRKNVCDKQSQLNDLTNDDERIQKKIESNVEKLRALEQMKCQQTKTLHDTIQAAENQGVRVEPEESSEEIGDEIKQIQSKLRNRAMMTDDPVDVELLIQSKSNSLKTNEQMYMLIRKSLHMLNNSRTQRFRYLSHLKKHFAFIVQFTFDEILKIRKFLGEISVDHVKQELVVSVKPGSQNMENAVCSTKSLSGGERSYTTVALLLSLWSCTDHPFYFLDEYDVFTDEINREFMTRLLLIEAKKKPNRQYLFLTPQDLAIESKDWVKIHKLAEPKR